LLEKKLETLQEQLENEKNPIKRMKIGRYCNRVEYCLSWQGADPRILSKDKLREVCNQPLHEDALVDKYRARVKNPATAIRAYCIDCQGGSVAGVKECAMLTCPLWNFRMGTDPLRGHEPPPPLPVSEPSDAVENDDFDSDLFADDEDEDNEDAED
jgi:hypothetical protein